MDRRLLFSHPGWFSYCQGPELVLGAMAVSLKTYISIAKCLIQTAFFKKKENTRTNGLKGAH
jgi:hypothetical protein